MILYLRDSRSNLGHPVGAPQRLYICRFFTRLPVHIADSHYWVLFRNNTSRSTIPFLIAAILGLWAWWLGILCSVEQLRSRNASFELV